MAKYNGRETVWKRATDATFTTLATLPNLREISAPLGGTRGEFDQSSYGDQWMDFGAAQIEGNEITYIFQHDPANTALQNLKTDCDNGASIYIQAEHTSATRKWRTTHTGKGSLVNPDRTGSLELHIQTRIVNPGTVESALP